MPELNSPPPRRFCPTRRTRPSRFEAIGPRLLVPGLAWPRLLVPGLAWRRLAGTGPGPGGTAPNQRYTLRRVRLVDVAKSNAAATRLAPWKRDGSGGPTRESPSPTLDFFSMSLDFFSCPQTFGARRPDFFFMSQFPDDFFLSCPRPIRRLFCDSLF